MINIFFSFVMSILPELIRLYKGVEDKSLSEDDEMQLAMSIIRKAKDKQAREEIGG